MIAIRIVNVDYYMCYPVRELDVNYSEFRGTEVRQVPVIQIYGSSQTGHKTCVNIHGVFPYVYIPYDGTESAGNLSYKIAAELDKALNISLGQASANTCHIHNIVLVSGIPLYGYHERQHQFFKIYFYNPAIVKKACSLLENGAVLGKCFQPYESHINYILQFMMDYNLHGMSFVNISHVMYRTNPEDPDLLYDIPPHSILPNDIQRRTICKYEMDAQASSITNKEEISTGKLAVNPGIAALWEDEKQRRRNKQMDSQISFSLTQERNEIMSTATQIFFENKLSQILSRVSQQSDESSLDLNKSVYPAETPDDTELINASIADHTVLDTTLLDETIQESQTLSETLTESDVKLLEILRDLKETAHVEEDSLLSQRMQQEESESSNEDEQNYSLSLSKIVPDDDSIWENSFWDENCEIPQLDGIYDTDTNEDTNDSWQSDFNICNMDGMNAAIYENEPDTWITNVEELQNKYRNANDVYIEIENFDIPLGKKLNRGKNKLILTERISPTIPPTRQIKVLSDVCIKCAEYANNEFGDIEHRKTDYVIDNNYNHEISIDDFVTNEVIINDIALGNNSPKSLRDWEDVDIPSSLIMSDPGSRTQSRANSIDYFDETFFNEFEELNDSFGKENDSIEKKTNKSTKKKKGRKAVKKTLNFDKPNNKSKDLFQKKTIKKQPNGTKSLSYDNPHIESKDVLQKQTYQYYLREISNASFTKKKCKFCSGCCDVEVFPPNPKPKKKPAVRHESYPLKVSPAAYHVSNRLNILEHSKPEAFLDSIPTNINDTNNAELDEDLPLAQDSIPADINYTSNEICEELDENLLLTQNSIPTDINYTSNEICEEINENLPLTQDSIPTDINYTSNEICEELDENLPHTQNSIPTDINYTSNEICEEINENLPLIQDSVPTDINYTSNDICEELNESLPQDSIPTDMNYTTNEICEEFDENLALAQYFPNTSLSSNDELSEQLATNCTIQSPKKDKIMETETNTNICTNNKVDKFTNEVHTDLNIVISITKTSIDEYNGVNNNEEQSLQYSATTNYTVDETQCVTKNENMFHIPTNYSSKEEIEFIKTKMLNWNLDGQADSPTSDSSSSIEEESSKKNITKKKNKNTASKSKSSTKKKTTCRTPGLIKPSVKKLKKTKRSNGSEIDSIEVTTESNKNNSIATEPMKKELKVVLLPLDLKSLKTVEQKINKKSDALNTKSVTRHRKKSGKDNLCCSSSLTDSSDIEQPGKKIKTEELNKAQILKESENLNAKNKKIVLTSSSDEEMRTKSFKNEIRMKRSVVHPRKHSNKIETFVRNTTDVQQSNNKINTEKSDSAAKMVICSSSSSDEVANTKKVKLSKLKTNRVKKNILTTKKSIDKSIELSDKIPKNLNHTSNDNFKELDEKPFGQNILETNLSLNNSEGVSRPEKRIQTPVMNQKELIVSSNFCNGKTESSKMKDQNCIQIVTPRATRRSMRKENQNNSLSSDSSNNSQEKLSGSINNTKSDTLVEGSQKINLKSKVLKEKSYISSDSSENTNKSSKIHQTANKKSEESNIHKEIASEEIVKKKLTNATEEKSPQQIQKETQSTLFKNVVVRLERLASMDLMHTTKTGINKNKDSPDTLNISPYSLKDDQQESSKTGNRNKLIKHARNGTRNEKKSKINNTNFANLNKSPTRGIKNKSNVLSPKYSPLNIIVRSPKKHSNLVQKENNSDYEPITKRLRTHSCVSGITPLNQNVNFKKKETENQKRSKGTGELQNIPVKQEGIQTHARNLKNIYIPTPQNCDIVKNELSTNTPDSIKKRLFNLENNNLNATVYEEFKTCSYENPSRKLSFFECPDINVEKDISYLRRLRQQEEFFLNNLDSHYSSKTNNPKQLTEEENSDIFDIELTNENRELDLSNKTTEQISTPVKLTNIKSKNQQSNTNFKSNNNQNNNETNENITSIRKPVKKKDKKPVSPIKFKDFDYFNINITPEKDKPDYSKNYYSPRETLSQQCEKELCNIDKYNTKIHNLTVAEKYDLKRDFAPQAGASGMSDEINRHMSPNYSFTYSNISFIDNSFMLNYSRSSQMGSQNLSISNEKTTKIWMPKYYPPSRQDIQNSLPDYNIPEYRFQQPFYSDYSDVTGKVDIGHNVLKIPSSTTADLAEFESSNDFCGIEKWRKEKFISLYPTVQLCKNFRTTLAGHSKMIITPVKPPPSRGDIVSWLKIKINGKEEKPVKKIDKPRIIIPLSPGNSNDSFNESMTLSPFTPEINSPPLTQNDIKSSQSTPVSSQESSSVIIKDKPRKKGNLQRKVLFSQSKQKSQEDEEKLKLLNLTESHSSNDSCQITGVTLDNTHGFQMSFENLQHAKALSEHQYLTILVVELHIRTRGELYPDPQYDSVRAIFYSILNDVPEDFSLPREETGVIVVDTLTGSPVKQQTPILEGCGVKCKINYVKSEIQLIDEFIKLIRKWDPDIFVGFEIEMLSWGYLIERCSVIGINLPVQISRINPAIIKKKQNDNKQSEQELKLNGRIILDAWRLFRHEIALQSYTFENLMYHILHQRVPAHSFKDLSFWWEYRSNYFRHITANYYITRVEGILKLLDQLDLIGRTSELARLFGIQFYEVLSRGSQFRVESMMLRLAKPLNYIPVSPSVQQRAKMRAPEFIPLILEPESRFYTDPLIVLDFQSLYPSIIIAYNYCFSTCIGRVDKLGSNLPFDFGACQLKISKARVRKLQNKINFSPCGVGFVKPEVRQGILPRMLKEILETRLMVKSSMKENKDNKLLQRVLHNRQLGLKLIANVTYGYTSANFSGRMPCIEVGDSVISKGRETLERAIKMIEQTERWRARVVYGDTDSLFVLVPGRSREEAFKIGAEIAEAVTNDNPPPVKLKLEKVYHPSLLQTKKRYVGYMYESPDQKEPEYNAKGIETVRRDGCPAVAKMLEKTLRLLFETRDMSLVKRYVCRQFEKLLTGRASIQDLVFAREYRGSSGYRPGACVPALELTRRWTATDKRREPRQGQRVPYVVVHGPPGLPIIRLVRCPTELLNPAQHSSLRPNAVYYITRVIAPPLNRCLSLIGADVQIWYNEMPRKQLQILPTDVHFENSKKSTISQYFATMSCVVCNNQTRDGLCENCYNNSQQTVVVLQEKLRQWERSFDDVKQICQSCCARVEYTDCVSLDCPVLYRLNQINRDLKQVPFVRNLIHKF